MFEEIRRQEINKINLKAKIEEQELEYITRIAKEYLRPAIKIFAKDEQNKEVLEKKVFEGIKKTINEIPEYYQVFGLIGPAGNDYKKINYPEVRLGWVKANSMFDCLHPTKKGFQVLDGLRKVQGKIPYIEAIENAREEIFGKTPKEIKSDIEQDIPKNPISPKPKNLFQRFIDYFS